MAGYGEGGGNQPTKFMQDFSAGKVGNPFGGEFDERTGGFNPKKVVKYFNTSDTTQFAPRGDFDSDFDYTKNIVDILDSNRIAGNMREYWLNDPDARRTSKGRKFLQAEYLFDHYKTKLNDMSVEDKIMSRLKEY